MAARLEKEALQARKALLIKQNEMHRQDLQVEVENLRGAAEWMERGYVFLTAVGSIRKWTAPLSQRRGKKRNSFVTVLRGCVVGFRIWKNLIKG